MSELLQSLKCSQCGGGPLTDNGDGSIACPFCGSTFAHPERVCPRCESVNEPGVLECTACGQTLQEPCVRCGTLNWVNASYCKRCGVALNILEHIAARRAEGDGERIRRLQAAAGKIKEETERSSHERLNKMWAQERERLEMLAKNKAEQQRQERIIVAIMAVAVVTVILVVIVLAVTSRLGLR
jgi:hypothetical protein